MPIDPQAFLAAQQAIQDRVDYVIEFDDIAYVEDQLICPEGVRLTIAEPLWGGRGETDVSYRLLTWEVLQAPDETLLAARRERLFEEARVEERRRIEEAAEKERAMRRAAVATLATLAKSYPDLFRHEGQRLAFIRMGALAELERLTAANKPMSERLRACEAVVAAVDAEAAVPEGTSVAPIPCILRTVADTIDARRTEPSTPETHVLDRLVTCVGIALGMPPGDHSVSALRTLAAVLDGATP